MKKSKKSEENYIRKLFGGINLTWPRLIIASILIGLLVGIIMINPDWKDTSISQIGVGFSWWVLFGTIIIANSKSNADSALKCFVFFLISQPLIYLVQVPFAEMGWGLFMYYKYWAIWTVLTLPMGFVGYYIKKNNIWSALILSGPIFLLLIEGIGYTTPGVDGEISQYFAMGILSLIFIALIIYGVLKDVRLWFVPIAIGGIVALVYFAPWENGTNQTFFGSYELTDEMPEVDDTWSISTTNSNYIVGITETEGVYSFDIEYQLTNSAGTSLIDFISPDGKTIYTCSFTTRLDDSASFHNCKKQVTQE